MDEARAIREAFPKGGRRAEATRRRLLDAADGLFYADGIRSTGVVAISERAGVTKMTFYAHFASKDELVCAYLRERDARWTELLEGTLARHEGPGDKLLAVFDAYREYVVSGGLRGCAFINCAAEFPDREHPARRVAREHKAGVRGRLTRLAAEAGAEEPEVLAEGLFVLLEGSYVTAAMEGDEGIVDRARRLAEDLVSAAVARPGPPEG
jgi:AcrR family transcriptional regulator